MNPITHQPIAEYESPWVEIAHLESCSQASADLASVNAGNSVASRGSANVSGSYDPSKFQDVDERTAMEIAIADSIHESIELAMESQSVVDSVRPTLESQEERPQEDSQNKKWWRRLHRAWTSAQAPVVPPETERAPKPPAVLRSEEQSMQDSNAREMLTFVHDDLLRIREKAKFNPSLLAGIDSVLLMISGSESHVGKDFAETQTAGVASSSNDESKASVTTQTAVSTPDKAHAEDRAVPNLAAHRLNWKSGTKLTKRRSHCVYYDGGLMLPGQPRPVHGNSISFQLGETHLTLTGDWKTIWETNGSEKLGHGVGFFWTFKKACSFGRPYYDVYVRPDLSRVVQDEEDIPCVRIEYEAAQGKIVKKIAYYGVSVVDT